MVVMDGPERRTRLNCVRRVRRSLDITQDELCRQTKISRATLFRIETNRGGLPSGEVMFRLAEALGTDLNTLFWNPSNPALPAGEPVKAGV